MNLGQKALEKSRLQVFVSVSQVTSVYGFKAKQPDPPQCPSLYTFWHHPMLHDHPTRRGPALGNTPRSPADRGSCQAALFTPRSREQCRSVPVYHSTEN